MVTKKQDSQWNSFLSKIAKNNLEVLLTFLKTTQSFFELNQKFQSSSGTIPVSYFLQTGMVINEIRKSVQVLNQIQNEFFPMDVGNYNPNVINVYHRQISIVDNTSTMGRRYAGAAIDKGLTYSVEGLSEIPTEEVEKRVKFYLNKRPLDVDPKISIVISENGIYRPERPSARYNIKGNRKEIVRLLLKRKTAKKLTSLAHFFSSAESNVSRWINGCKTEKGINDLFREDLHVKEDLILLGSRGYYLNREHYEIKNDME